MRNAASLALAAAFTLAGASAWAQAPQPPGQVLYKLVDKNGKVTYVDKVPKGYDGEVTRIDIDAAPDLVRPPPLAPAPATPAKPTIDINAARRANREKFQAAIDAAHVKLADARKALAAGVEPKEGEYQPIQQKFDATGAKPDSVGPRPNCTQRVEPTGARYWLCPTITPGSGYRDRQKDLEEAVRLAEDELEAAQRAYRRNVD